MKNNFSNFFEIGKLDKGLFRVWVILSIIWLIVMGVVYLNSYEIRAFSKAKKITSNYDIYCEAIEQTKTRWKKNVKTNLLESTGFYKTGKIIYGYKAQVGSLGTLVGFGGTFWSYSECVASYEKEKSEAFLNMIPLIIFYFIAPFILALFYLLSKKMTLWIYRGFK